MEGERPRGRDQRASAPWDPALVPVRQSGRQPDSPLLEEPGPLGELTRELRCIASFDGRLLQVSRSWTTLLGWEPERLTSGSYLDLVHPDDVEATIEAMQVLERGEHVVGFENRYRHRAGGYRWLRWHSVPVVLDQLVYAVVQDVTEERRRQSVNAQLERVTGVGTWDLDLDTQRTVWSSVVHEIYATDPASFDPSVEDGLAFYPPEAQERLIPAFEAMVADGTPYDLELPFRDAAGQARWIRTTGHAEVRMGRVVRAYGTFQDITDAYLEREGLRGFQQLVELSAEGLLTFDAEGTIRYANQRMAELVGMAPAELIGRSGAVLLAAPDDPEQASRWRARLEQAAGQPVRDVIELQARDGSRRWVQVAARVEPPDSEGSVATDGPALRAGDVIAVVTDITMLRERERELRESEERLDRVLTAINDGWWDLDLTTGAARYSDRFHEMLGHAPGSLEPVAMTWREQFDPEDMARLEVAFGAVVAEGRRQVTVPTRMRHRRGHHLHVLIRGLIDYADDGTPVRASGAVADETALRHAEQAKERFVSTVSHELRTPLTSITGALDLLTGGATGPLSDGARELVELAQRNTARLRRLIDDLLDMEALVTGQTSFALTVRDLPALLAEVVADNQPYAAKHGVTIVLDEVLPRARVEVDEVRLGQVLANLLANAARYGPDGSDVEVVAARRGPVVRVGVTDHGPGVPEGFASRIFQRFEQADPMDPRSRGGTGLGLAISREIIERLGGELGYDSVPGHTTFWFELPVVGG